MKKIFWIVACLLLTPAGAQSPEAAPVTPDASSSGTTIVGEDESPMGLFIMPWKNSSADSGLDKPARLLDEAMLPLDKDVFRRQIEYYQTLSEHRNSQGVQP